MSCSRGCCETQAEHFRSLTVVSRSSLTKPVVREGKAHPESGRSWKRTEDEGSIITEHNTRTDRVDAVAKVQTIHANVADFQDRKVELRGR